MKVKAIACNNQLMCVLLPGETKAEFDNEEYYIRSHYSSVADSIKLFAGDDLACKPGGKAKKHTYNHHTAIKLLFS